METCEVSKPFLSFLKEILKPESLLLESAVAKLYTATHDSKRWHYTNQWGVLCLIKEPNSSGAYLALFDYFTFELLFTSELYFNFSQEFLSLNPLFYYFEIENFTFVGLSFANEAQAKKLCDAISKLEIQVPNSSLNQLKKKQFDKMKVLSSQKKTKTSILLPPFSLLLAADNISPNFPFETSPDQEYHLSRKKALLFDPRRGSIRIDCVPKDWKDVFAKAGIDKTLLSDPQTSQLITSTIFQARRDSLLSESSDASHSIQNIPPPPPLLLTNPPPPLLSPIPEEEKLPHYHNADLNHPSLEEELLLLKKKLHSETSFSEISNPSPEEKTSLVDLLRKAVQDRRAALTKNDNSSSEESPWSDSD